MVTLSAIASFVDGTALDVTDNPGITYRTSNAAVATIGATGSVTIVSSGFVLLSATYEGALGLFQISVRTSGDTDGDGLPDDWEIANGLDPNDPGDALLDPDGDGLSTLEEFQLGLDPFDRDTDGDGLADGEEVATRGTNPLLFDTDGDGISDGLEIRTGSDPLDATSFNLAEALESLSVTPEAFTIYFNAVLGEASRQLVVTGQLIDGTNLDITSSFYGTSYSSSDLTIANFGADPGRVFAGLDGIATVTVENSGFTDTAVVEVIGFSPTALSYLRLSGRPRGLARQGRTLYAAMDRGGVQVVNVQDPEAPFVVSTFYPRAAGETGSSAAWDVTVEGDLLYLAAGAAGLVTVDASNPGDLIQLAASNPSGSNAFAVATKGDLAVLGSAGRLDIFDLADPAAPLAVGFVDLPGTALDVKVEGNLAIVALGGAGLRTVDLSDPANPIVTGATHLRPNDISRSSGLALAGGRVVVADGGSPRSLGGLGVVDISDPQLPVVTGRTNNAFGLVKVAVDDFGLALAADYFFVNSVPIFRLGSGNPTFASILDFSGPPSNRDDDGIDLVVDRGLVYLLAQHWYYGTGALHIGRYLLPNDEAGVPPTVAIADPSGDVPVRERRRIVVTAEAEDDIHVRSVEIFASGVSLGRDFDRPFQREVVVPDGQTTLSLSAVAWDGADNQGSSEVVEVPIDPDTSPAVALRSPRPGDLVAEGARVQLAAEASDDLAVRRVEFYADGALVDTDFSTPYQATYFTRRDAPTQVLTARAYDAFEQMTESEPVPLAVIQDEPPLIALVEPTAGVEIVEGTPITLVAAASDDGGVQRVTFYRNGNLDDIDLQGPPWSARLLVPAAGTSTTISAVAVDTDGQETTSAAVTFSSVPDPLTSVAGQVVGPDGEPVGGATVTVKTDDGASYGSTTGSDGAFLVEGVATNEGGLIVEARGNLGGEDLFGALPEALSAIPGGTVDAGILGLETTLVTNDIIGVIVDGDGNPVAGALVRVHNRFVKRETFSEADGSFRVLEVPATYNRTTGTTGSVRLYPSAFATIDGAAYRGKTSSPLFSSVLGSTRDAGTITLQPSPESDPLTTATGNVAEDTGAGIPGADLAVSSDFDLYRTVSDLSGSYSLPEIPALDGRLGAVAEVLLDGIRVRSDSPLFGTTPTAGGVTNLGTIVFPTGEGGGGPGD